MHRLGCLPFYCFREEDFFPSSSLNHPHSCPLARYRPTPTPALSLLVEHTAHAQQHSKERERGAREAQPQSPVCFFSLQYCCYLPSCLGFSTQRTFCFFGLCLTLQKAHLFLYCFLFPFLPLLYFHLALR